MAFLHPIHTKLQTFLKAAIPNIQFLTHCTSLNISLYSKLALAPENNGPRPVLTGQWNPSGKVDRRITRALKMQIYIVCSHFVHGWIGLKVSKLRASHWPRTHTISFVLTVNLQSSSDLFAGTRWPFFGICHHVLQRLTLLQSNRPLNRPSHWDNCCGIWKIVNWVHHYVYFQSLLNNVAQQPFVKYS